MSYPFMVIRPLTLSACEQCCAFCLEFLRQRDGRGYITSEGVCILHRAVALMRELPGERRNDLELTRLSLNDSPFDMFRALCLSTTSSLHVDRWCRWKMLHRLAAGLIQFKRKCTSPPPPKKKKEYAYRSLLVQGVNDGDVQVLVDWGNPSTMSIRRTCSHTAARRGTGASATARILSEARDEQLV